MCCLVNVQIARRIWLGKGRPDNPDAKDETQFKKYLSDKYEKKLWYDPNGATKSSVEAPQAKPADAAPAKLSDAKVCLVVWTSLCTQQRDPSRYQKNRQPPAPMSALSLALLSRLSLHRNVESMLTKLVCWYY